VNDFYDWKKHPITQVIYQEFEARVKFLMEQLVEQASTGSPTELADKAGIVKGYRDFLNMTVEDFVQETEQ
jgi:hypothetical protein